MKANKMKSLRLLVLSCLLLGMGTAVFAQDQVVEIKPKRTLFVPKLDLFWASVVIAEDFPTFFPLEVECNLPSARLSISPIFSAWKETFTETSIANEQTRLETSSFILGVGVRYYAALTKGVPGQGLFIEPQFFYRGGHTNQRFQANDFTPPVFTEYDTKETAFMGAVGYQHQFLRRLYVQGRVSFGYTDTAIMSGFRFGSSDQLMFLPWVGIGYGF